MKLQLYYPLKPSILTQGFGLNDVNYGKLLGFKGHPGEDWANISSPAGWPNNPAAKNLSYGMPVRAAHDGEVIQLEVDTNGGYTVCLITDQAYDYGNAQTHFKSVYAHCIKDSFKVKLGDKVKIGDILALCGATGVYPNDPLPHPEKAHIHFGLKPATLMSAVGEESAWWENTEQNNGYGGAIDNSPYWTGIYAEDYVSPAVEMPPEPPPASPITPEQYQIVSQEISLVQKIVALIKLWLRL